MSIYIRAGRLRHRVTQQREVETADGGGGYALSWENIDTFWASVEPLVGRESEQSRQLEDSVTHKIVCRGPRDIQAKDRILYDGRAFNIRVIRNIQERGHRIEMQADEGVAT